MIPSPPEALQQKRQRARKWLKKHKLPFLIGVLLGGLLCIPLIAYGVFRVAYAGKIMPNVYAGPVHLSGLTTSQAQEYLDLQQKTYTQSLPQELTHQQHAWQLPTNLVTFDAASDAQKAYALGRDGSITHQIAAQWKLLQAIHASPLTIKLDEGLSESLTASIAATLDVPAKKPQLVVEKSATQSGSLAIAVLPGTDGVIFDQEAWKNGLITATSSLLPVSTQITLDPQPITITADQIEEAKIRAEKLLDKKLIIKHDDSYHTWVLEKQPLIALVSFNGDFDQEALQTYVETLSEEVDRQPVNARFQFDAAINRVTEFSPALAGLTTNIAESTTELDNALNELERDELKENEVALVVTEAFPEISLDTVNDLGIRELLGRGVSTYTGSIASRVHNVALAASRISGVLIKPGETFSFNANVGDITRETGYQAAYVIKNGRTELGDGGGVCQDSTTVFRAALDAGLPIVERRGHSYRVGYYEQNAKPGLDATVYSPSTDLKFLNDTPGHLLLQTIVDSPNRVLTVELYGTDDGREAEVKNHKLWDVSPPPPDVIVEDASIPAGQTKQVDWKAWGAKASFDYVVRRDGQIIIEKTFTSVYKPWAAVFLKGPSI
jgi:vancomycin resistance protein YoaR